MSESAPVDVRVATPNSLASASVAGTLDDLLPFEARGYLDEKVLPVLLLAVTALVRERPENPVDYVAHFLMRHSKAAARAFVEVPPQGGSV